MLAGIPGRVFTDASGSMNCRTFRKFHMDFADGLLNERRSAEMYEHLDSCVRCARHDVATRRGLLVVRNLPRIEPSPDFMARLQTKLCGSEQPGPSHAPGSRARIAIELGAAVAVAVAVTFIMLHPGWTRSPASIVPQAAAVAEARPSQDTPGGIGRERTPTGPSFNTTVASMMPVLMSDMATGGSAGPRLVDAASRIPSLSP